MRLVAYIAISTLLLGCSTTVPSRDTSAGADGASSDAGDVPEGMRSLATSGSGHVFTTTLNGSRSAQQLAQALMQGMQAYFGGSAHLLQAIADPSDTRVQAAFSAQRDGVPVMGVLAITVRGESGQAVVMFDEKRALGGSIDRLMQVAASGGADDGSGGAPPAPEPLTRTPIPDGSGSIDLAPGWVIRFAQKGAMDISGPTPGAGMSLGAVAPMPLYSYDPVEALQRMTDAMSRQSGKRLDLTILDSRPMEWAQGGRAALVRYRVVTDEQSMDYFALIGVTPFEQNQVFLYTSYIQAPTQRFAQVFPTALRSWGSWSINPAVLAQRMQQAAQTMRETGEILTGSGSSSSRAFDGVNAGWGQYLRGVATLEDGDRTKSEVDQRFAERVVQNDPNNFRIVPTSELVP